jgi:hypothetical protein
MNAAAAPRLKGGVPLAPRGLRAAAGAPRPRHPTTKQSWLAAMAAGPGMAAGALGAPAGVRAAVALPGEITDVTAAGAPSSSSRARPDPGR